MNTILYATDYSKNSETALRYAYHLSLKLNAKLEVIHIFNYPKVLENEIQEDAQNFEPDAFKRNRNRLKTFCKDYLDETSERIKTDAVKNNSVVDGILAKAKEIDPLFIIMGAKGISKIKDFFIGNTTKRLMEKAAYTILSIPYSDTVKDIKSIVYATALENDDINAICRLVDIAKPLDAMIKVVHISTKKEYDGEAQMEWFKEMFYNKLLYDKISFDIIFNDDIINSLTDYAEKHQADLIAMLERNNNGFLNNLLNKNKIKLMNDYGKYPLMVFNKSKCLSLNLS